MTCLVLYRQSLLRAFVSKRYFATTPNSYQVPKIAVSQWMSDEADNRSIIKRQVPVYQNVKRNRELGGQEQRLATISKHHMTPDKATREEGPKETWGRKTDAKVQHNTLERPTAETSSSIQKSTRIDRTGSDENTVLDERKALSYHDLKSHRLLMKALKTKYSYFKLKKASNKQIKLWIDNYKKLLNFGCAPLDISLNAELLNQENIEEVAAVLKECGIEMPTASILLHVSRHDLTGNERREVLSKVCQDELKEMEGRRELIADVFQVTRDSIEPQFRDLLCFPLSYLQENMRILRESRGHIDANLIKQLTHDLLNDVTLRVGGDSTNSSRKGISTSNNLNETVTNEELIAHTKPKVQYLSSVCKFSCKDILNHRGILNKSVSLKKLKSSYEQLMKEEISPITMDLLVKCAKGKRIVSINPRQHYPRHYYALACGTDNASKFKVSKNDYRVLLRQRVSVIKQNYDYLIAQGFKPEHIWRTPIVLTNETEVLKENLESISEQEKASLKEQKNILLNILQYRIEFRKEYDAIVNNS